MPSGISQMDAKAMSDSFTKKRITATKGPTYIFQGRLLGSNRIGEQGFDEWLESELWETPAGAWVAVLAYRYEDSGRDFVLAGVVPPEDDERSRVFAALDIMEWSICAKSMMSKKKFSLVVKVD
jgi:hypothetical protein